MEPFCTIDSSPGPVVVTAIHAGHDLSPAVAERCALDAATRLREEDPFTDRLIPDGQPSVAVRRSRFEVDLNRPRERAVYRTPDDAWGLPLWTRPLLEEEVAVALELYDAFYRSMSDDLDERAAAGPFVVLDLHSYNHRRGGPDAPPEPEAANPEINVGTRSLDRERCAVLLERLETGLVGSTVAGRHPDVRRDVRFKGGELCRWVNTRYAGRGCGIALEFKKVFMDEWTGAVDERHLGDLATAVASTVDGLRHELDGGR